MRLPVLKMMLAQLQGIAGSDEILVIGSAALLNRHPDLGESGGAVELSLDADVVLNPTSEDLASQVDQKMGSDSSFHQQHGVYVDVMRPEIAETFPRGWEKRVDVLAPGGRHVTMGVGDVLATKLWLGREKDLALCRGMMAGNLIDSPTLKNHLDQMVLSESDTVSTYQRFRALSEEIEQEREGQAV